MDDWLMQSTTAALDRMTEHAAVVGLPNTDEATFRSFFMAALKARVPSARLETEWKWFDLLVQMSQVNALVEFKYYLHRRCIDLDGRHLPWKGGAGAQNEREFYQCVDKLKACGHSPIHVRYLVLVYERLATPGLRKCFGTSYGGLTVGGPIAELAVIERPPLFCTVLRIE